MGAVGACRAADTNVELLPEFYRGTELGDGDVRGGQEGRRGDRELEVGSLKLKS